MKKWFILNISLPFFLKLCMPDGRAGLWPLIAIDMFLLPGCLVCLNAIAVLRAKSHILLVATAALIGLVSGNLIGYIRWGISSGNMFNPDGETIWIIEKIFIYQICFVAVGFGIIAVIKAIRKRNSRANQQR